MQHDASTGPGAAAIGASLQLGSMEEGGMSRTFAPKIGSKNGRFFIFHNAATAQYLYLFVPVQ